MAKSIQDYLEQAPAYVNGTLAGEERAAFEREIAQNPTLAAETEIFKKIAAAAKSAPDTAPNENELGWRRLEKAISSQTAAPAPNTAPTPANMNSPFWRYAAAILGVVALGQTMVLINNGARQNEARYVAASAADKDQFTAKVEFRDDARAGDIRALLDDIDGEIINGPSARGLYQLTFDSPEARDNALLTLKEQDAIVALAAAE